MNSQSFFLKKMVASNTLGNWKKAL